MVAWRVRLRGLAHGELSIAAAAAAGTMLLAYAGSHKLGTPGLALPLAVLLAVILMRKPIVMVTLLAGLAILCEGPTFGLFGFTSQLYNQLYKGLTGLDVLVALTVVSVLLEVMRSGRALRVPRPLALGLTLLLLAMIAGAVTGHAAGQSIRSVVLGENVLAYLLFLPIAIANLKLERYQLVRMIMVVGALAIVKAAAGVVEVIGHYGTPVEGRADAHLLRTGCQLADHGGSPDDPGGGRDPRQAATVDAGRDPAADNCAGALLPALVLDRRRPRCPAGDRSRHIAYRPAHAPSRGPGVAGGDLAARLASASNPLGLRSCAARSRSLPRSSKQTSRTATGSTSAPTCSVRSAASDHRAGNGGPWAGHVQPAVGRARRRARVRSLRRPVVLAEAGHLGLFAYVTMLAGGAVLAWQAWRRSPEPLSRAFGLGSLCAIAGLHGDGHDCEFHRRGPRFTVLFATQLGLLALLVGSKASARDRLS